MALESVKRHSSGRDSREAEIAEGEAAQPSKAFTLPPYGAIYRGLLS